MPTELKYLSAEKLDLDDENPRLPEDIDSSTQNALLEWMANEYNTLEVAQSIAEHGFFDSEPLIAVKKGAIYKVLEGNRRLTAVKLLLNDDLRHSLNLEEAESWEDAADAANLEDSFPVQIASSRQAVAPIIGYRHIAGIEPWEPWAKARFIARQIEKEKLSFAQVAIIVGERESDVRANYRNYRVAIDAQKKLKVDSSRVKENFGFFTRAMNSVGLREHIRAPSPQEMKANKAALRSSSRKQVAELFSWLFGDDNHDAVISESRRISDLGQAVASTDALAVLRKTRNLEDAMLASGGVRERLIKLLTKALGNLQKAELDIENYDNDSEVIELIDACRESLARLKET